MQWKVMFILMVDQIFLVQASVSTTANPGTCRYKTYDFTQDEFKSLMPIYCFRFLFPKVNLTFGEESCTVLTGEQCSSWKSCVRDAEICCSLQKDKEAIEIHSNDTVQGLSSCAHTWDGFSCWESTLAGNSVTKICPTYATSKTDNEGLFVTNYCRENGTWNTHPETNEQWTDYSPCFLDKFEESKIIQLVSIYVNGASVLMLAPSIVIFMAFKFLRREMAIRIHTSFFVSLFFASVMRVCFTSLVIYQYLINSGSRLLVKENKMECLTLYLIHRYFQITTYFWMFCEAFHLHQLMVNSFRPPRQTYAYHAFSWSCPFLLLMIYAILRWKYMESDEDQYNPISNCWIQNGGLLELVISVPVLLGLFVNVVFLCHIIRRLLGLQTQPNEPSSFRRSIKAIFLLFPLFGMQSFIIIPGVSPSSPHYFWFSILSEIVIGSKGFTVAILFCFMNGEVLYYLRKSGLTCLPESRPESHRQNSNPTIQSDVSRGSTINKTSVNYNGKPKESCDLLMTSLNIEEIASEKKDCLASSAV